MRRRRRHRQPLARKDGLRLARWTRADGPRDGTAGEGVALTAEPYAACDVALDTIAYTDDEYALVASDEWSRAETDYLFALCRDLHLRFFAVADRYAYAGHARSLDDIKARYYAVTKRILEHRHPLADPDTKARIAALAFNKDKEMQRKAAIERFNARSLDELRDEEQVLMQCRQISTNIDQLLHHRRHILCVMKPMSVAGPMLNTLATSEFGPDGMSDQSKWKNKKKIKKKSGVDDDKRRPSSISLAGSGVDSDSPFIPSISHKKEKRVAGVFVRSQIMSNAIKNQNILQKVQAVLLEYGLRNDTDNLHWMMLVALRPKMPTSAVCAHFDEVIQNIVVMLELKRQTEKLEHDLQHLTQKHDLLRASVGGAHDDAVNDSESVDGDDVAKRRRNSSPPPRPDVKRPRK